MPIRLLNPISGDAKRDESSRECPDKGAKSFALDRPSVRKLLIQVRRATGEDQIEVLRWLTRKFPIQAGKIVTSHDFLPCRKLFFSD